MTDLASRVLAAIEKTERLAREAAATDAGPDWRSAPCDGGQCEGHLLPEGSVRELIACYPWEGGGLYEPLGPHIAHNDPAAVLRRCAADRKLLALHSPPSDDPGCCWTCYGVRLGGEYDPAPFPCPTITALAEGHGVPTTTEGEET